MGSSVEAAHVGEAARGFGVVSRMYIHDVIVTRALPSGPPTLAAFNANSCAKAKSDFLCFPPLHMRFSPIHAQNQTLPSPMVTGVRPGELRDGHAVVPRREQEQCRGERRVRGVVQRRHVQDRGPQRARGEVG